MAIMGSTCLLDLSLVLVLSSYIGASEERDPRHPNGTVLGRPITVFVSGVGPQSVPIRISRSSTVSDVFQTLRRRHLITSLARVRYTLHYDRFRRAALDPEHTLGVIGVEDLSILVMRCSVPGGSRPFQVPAESKPEQRNSQEQTRLLAKREAARVKRAKQAASLTPLPTATPSSQRPVPTPSGSSTSDTHHDSTEHNRAEEPPLPYQREEPDRRVGVLKADLTFIQSHLSYQCTVLDTSRSLRFLHNPDTSGAFQYTKDLSGILNANSGTYALDATASVNRVFLDLEHYILSMLAQVKETPVALDPGIDQLCADVTADLHRSHVELEMWKEAQWNRQRDALAIDIHETGSPVVPVVVNTGPFFLSPLTSLDPTIALCYLIVLTMHLLFNLSFDSCTVLLAGLSGLLRILHLGVPSNAASRPAVPYRLPADPRTILSGANLDSEVEEYAQCPDCYALYQTKPFPETCVHQETQDSPLCGKSLLRSRVVGKTKTTHPLRTYLHQRMRNYMARLLSREGIEDIMDKAHLGRDTEGRGVMEDIWDSPMITEIKAKDGTPFIRPPPTTGCEPVNTGPEGRYVFSLSVDGFNPFGSKTAKQTVTSTAIYMVCMNLPPHLRYLDENLYLVGIVPGPSKPSLQEMNHSLRPLVDDLLELWDPGVSLSRTAKYRKGRLVKCALGPLVCDLPAARQCLGMAGISSTHPCSLCWITLADLEVTDTTKWPRPRTGAEHRRLAEQWLDADIDERAKLYLKYGVRWSELLRLPYWDPIRFTVVDSMHNHYLGLLQAHAREMFGMNVDLEDDDGTLGRKGVAKPSAGDMAEGLTYLTAGNVKKLLECRVAVLWHLCFAYNLRRAKKTKKYLVNRLMEWYGSTHPNARAVATSAGIDPGPSGSANAPAEIPDRSTDVALTLDPAQIPVPSTHPSASNDIVQPDLTDKAREDLKKADARFSKSLDQASLAKLAKAMERWTNPVLASMCASRGVRPEKLKAALIQKLLQWRKDHLLDDTNNSSGEPAVAGPTAMVADQIPGPVAAGGVVAGKRNGAVLGKTTLTAIHNDMRRTILPSWVSRAPGDLGSTSRGKLSADQWRAASTINFPITLIRLWGKSTGRQRQMLSNFMHLVTAVEIGGMRVMSKDLAAKYNTSLGQYLDGAKTLYKESSIKPNHHLAIHIGTDIMPFYGPLHSIRAFSTERNNYRLQQENVNRKFGEMENTFMKHTCRSSNLRALFDDPEVEKLASGLISSYWKVFRSDVRGTRVRGLLSQLAVAEETGSKGVLPDDIFAALLLRLNEESGTGTTQYGDLQLNRRPPGQLMVDRKVEILSRIHLEGIKYSPSSSRSQGDSCVAFRHPDEQRVSVGRIRSIFRHTRRTSPKAQADTQAFTTDVFICVSPLKDLSNADATLDDYRTFGHAGGSLYYDDYEFAPLVIRPDGLISHVAWTTFEAGQCGIESATVHALPLDRMAHLFKILESQPADTDAMEVD